MTNVVSIETGLADIRGQVNKAVAKAELQGRERFSLMTTVQFLDRGGIKLTQIGTPECAPSVTLTQGQTVDLMERISAMVLRAQVEAGRS